jgi:hypothetical protein
MRDVVDMRTTLNLDHDVLRAVKELARLQGTTAGHVLSELARTALGSNPEPEPVRNGVPILPPTPDAGIVIPDVVDQLLNAEGFGEE